MPRPLRSATLRPAEVPYYHLWCRCVRRLRLTDDDRRKDFMLARLKALHAVFAVEVCRYALMGNHFHLIVRVNPAMAERWSARETVARWAALHPPRSWGWKPLNGDALDFWIATKAQDEAFVAQTRAKLLSVPEFMKDFKQSVAAAFNRRDKARGAFWQGRYGCAALDSDSKLLSSMVYVDLNPHAAGLCALPEEAPHTSLHEGMASRAKVRAERGEAGEAQTLAAPARLLAGGQIEAQAAKEESGASTPRRPATDLGHGRQQVVPQAEKHAWMVPVSRETPHARSGMFAGMAFEDYLRLVDFAARKSRQGKAKLDDAAAGILERAHVMEDAWWRELGRCLGLRWV